MYKPLLDSAYLVFIKIVPHREDTVDMLVTFEQCAILFMVMSIVCRRAA